MDRQPGPDRRRHRLLDDVGATGAGGDRRLFHRALLDTGDAGRDLVSGLPKTLQISDGEIRAAIEEPVSAIIDSIKATLDRTPPELAGDIMHKGITLTGGGALLRGIDKRLRHETGMPIHVTDRPLDSVAMGSGKCVEEFEALQQVLISEPRH